MLDTLIIILLESHWSLISPPQGMKVPGNEDVLEDGTHENIQREAINCRLQVSAYQLQVRISFMHNWNARAFFIVMFSCKNKASVDIPRSLLLNC